MDRASAPAVVIPQILAAARAYDLRAIIRALDHSLDVRGLDRTVDDLLLPAMNLVGRSWADGSLDIAEEHLASTAVQVWLGKINALAPEPRLGPVVLACGPRDLHTISMDCMAAMLAYRGVDCRNLGARTPRHALARAVRTLQPAAVILVSHHPRAYQDAVRSLQELSAASDVSLYYAGAAFATPDACLGLPGRYLGNHLTYAASLVANTLRLSPGAAGVTEP